MSPRYKPNECYSVFEVSGSLLLLLVFKRLLTPHTESHGRSLLGLSIYHWIFGKAGKKCSQWYAVTCWFPIFKAEAGAGFCPSLSQEKSFLLRKLKASHSITKNMTHKEKAAKSFLPNISPLKLPTVSGQHARTSVSQGSQNQILLQSVLHWQYLPEMQI